MKRFACLAFVLVAACGDDGTTTIDAAAIDAANIDARVIDAAIDAAPTVYGGTFTALEVSLLNPTGAPTPVFGQGLQVGISFSDSVTAVAPTMEEQPGSPLGCKLFSFTAAQARADGNNEGDVVVAFTGGTLPATPPNVPTCKFTANLGYSCPFTGTGGTGGTIAVAAPNSAGTLTVPPPGAFNDGNSLGAYVSISGAANAANNGVFPIIMRPAANVIVYGNPRVAAEALPAAATHVNVAGVGPIPGKADPGFLADDSAASFTFTPGAGGHLPAFVASTGAGTVGDDFTLSAAMMAKLNAVPTAAGEFKISCDPADGGTCGSATGSLLNIVTTDAPTAGLSPFTLPLPTTKRLQVRCASIGQTSVTVPAAYMAALAVAGVTRVQASFIRPTLMSTMPGTPSVNALSGHAIVGFTNRQPQ